MKIDLKSIVAKLTPILGFFRRYIKLISVLVILFIALFFVFRINQYSRIEPTDDAVSEKLQTVQRPKVDQSVLSKIQELKDQNVQVQTLFDQARDNPFNEQ